MLIDYTYNKTEIIVNVDDEQIVINNALFADYLDKYNELCEEYETYTSDYLSINSVKSIEITLDEWFDNKSVYHITKWIKFYLEDIQKLKK